MSSRPLEGNEAKNLVAINNTGTPSALLFLTATGLSHALLDAIRPQLWNAASIEVASFHEAFGDISAMLGAGFLRHQIADAGAALAALAAIPGIDKLLPLAQFMRIARDIGGNGLIHPRAPPLLQHPA